MKLYLVKGHDVEGEDQDYFVVSENPQKAVILWNEYLVNEGYYREEGDEEESLPIKKVVEPSHVREVLPDVINTNYAGAERVIEWENIPMVA
jgi:hypothetical protein